jgi:transmembrane sensor
MDYGKEELSILIEKYLNDQISPAEYRDLWRLLNEHPDEVALNDELKRLWATVKSAPPVISGDVWREKMELARQEHAENIPVVKKVNTGFNRYRWSAAAAIFLLIISSIFFLTTRKEQENIVQNNTYPQDRLPGGERAVLTLSDGSVILLDSAGNGVLAKQGSTEIIKRKDGQLVYSGSDKKQDEIVYNLLQTPRGGQYNITLPDGSKVWLNAASSLKYPVSFAGKERRVEITGEAYFEIAKDVSRPFKVQMKQMEVEVLGTHFNINGYDDELSIRTTLLEGKVRVGSGGKSNYLKPGQQAQVSSSGNMKMVDDVNLEETVAWKDGFFQFENSDIQSVMRQLSRWYDVDVQYKGTVSKHFIGGISRDVNLSQVLTMLQQTGEVKFIIEGQKIIVMP